MTDKPTPTDAELKAMWQLHAADIGGIFYYARAVLAKWGASHGQAPAGATEPTEQQILEAAFAPAQPAAEPSRFGSPELQAMIIARCVEKDQADSVQEDAARYRAFRDCSVDDRNRLEHYSGPALDVAVDTFNAARKQGEKQ